MKLGRLKNVYLSIHFAGLVVAMYAIAGVVNAFMHRVGFYKRMNPDETLHNQAE